MIEELKKPSGVISALADRPKNLSAAQLKAKFDAVPDYIIEFINNVLIPAIEEGYSEESFTGDLLNKLNGIEYGAEVNIPADTVYNPESENAQSGKAVAEAVSALVNSAPEALDTLKELADALGNDSNHTATMLELIGTKADKAAVEKALLEKADAAGIESRLSEKADKTEVSEALEAKADKTYVGSEISQKASTADVEAALELKADKAGLEAKADKSEIPAKISDLEDDTEATPVQYANKAYCDEYGANIASNYQLKSYIVDKISASENLDSEHYPSVMCLANEITYVTNSLTYYATKTELSEVEAVAKGRATGYVFDTLEELDSWLENPNNTAGLVLGDNLYIRATDVPDYWWDGSARQQLETQKVDLSEYATKEEVGEIEAALDKIIAIQNTLIGGEAV